MKNVNVKRRGFTLVELLIVIVVIGILSAMMMLSSSEAVSSAKATAIISDLRSLKTAALAYFADNFDTYNGKTNASNSTNEISTNKNKDEWEKVISYLNGKDFPTQSSYKLLTDGNGNAWYVEISISGTGDGITPLYSNKNSSECIAVKKKLAGRAKSAGLLQDRNSPKPYDESYEYVLMLVQ